MRSVFRVFAGLSLVLTAQAGILVLRTDKGVQFVEAAVISIGGKDKVLSVGAQPRLAGPINKLPSIKLTGTVLKSGDAVALATWDGAPHYFIPEGLPKTAPADIPGIWAMSKVAYKKAPNDKVPAEVSVAEFAAFLPGGVEELSHLCTDPAQLEFISGKGKGFELQLQLAAASAKEYASDPAMATLQHYVEQAMRTRFEQFESGLVGVEALNQGLEFAKLSAAAYPNTPEQKQLRDALETKRKWLDRKIAILRAFATAEDWDAFLLADRDIERYRAAFRDMIAMHNEALTKSLLTHKTAGEQRTKEHEYGAAWREFRLASLRKPSDTVLRQNVRTAWGDYSGQLAKDHQGQRKPLTPGERSAIAQDLQRAKLDLDVKKPDRALVEVQEAERIDPSSLDVLLRKAEVLGALGQFRLALTTLNEYDKLAVDEERTKAGELRANLEFLRDNSLDDIRTQLRKIYAAGSYHQARNLVMQGLESSADDPELLLFGGRLGLILRDAQFTRTTLQHYLDVTTTLDANEEERDVVRHLMGAVREQKPVADGTPNWMSGLKLPPTLFYCPASGAFQPKIDRVVASNKLTETFEWEGDRIRAITPSFDKDVRVSAESKILFAYDTREAGVSWAGTTADPRGPATNDADALFRRSMVKLSNNPLADPLAIQVLTNQNVAVGIAGNRFFDPFVWDKVHYFQLNYDDQGRIYQAREVADPKSAPGDQWVDFEWDGLRLKAIRAYQGADISHRTKIYDRTMQYQDNRLVTEEIQYQGKSYKVRYNYNGGRLATAVTEKDPSLDDRSRQVTFR